MNDELLKLNKLQNEKRMVQGQIDNATNQIEFLNKIGLITVGGTVDENAKEYGVSMRLIYLLRLDEVNMQIIELLEKKR